MILLFVVLQYLQTMLNRSAVSRTGFQPGCGLPD